MTHTEFFKLQAKNLFRDYQSKTKVFDQVIGDFLYEYSPKYFNIASIVLYFDIDEEDFSLMKAQHIIAKIIGFRKWTDLLNASEVEQELAKLLFDNQDKISAEDWEMYILGAERDNNTTFDPDTRLEIFKQVFANVEGHVSTFPDYRLHKQAS
ncbi:MULTISPECIES: hypothetical protein [Niastella]|uniref:Uncharacterized protein n=1 Tax=Niastella soli TaxID=2821487 RepID=A0ABS3YNM5_9BACT|nr:hypothetical protein [Niastella soli]MBO9199423.1 hypothetical protein [Niastella soli]